MFAEPAKWLVRGLAWLPDALRPGVFLALVFALVWLLVRQRILPPLWHGTCRVLAVTVDTFVGLALYPEYRLSAARRQHGEPPGRIALQVSPLANGVLDGARTLYQGHVRPPTIWRRPPWKTMLAVIVVCAAAWFTMDQVQASSPLKHPLSATFDTWRDVEAWANVDPSRRAISGEPALPTIQSRHRKHGLLHVLVRCPAGTECHGWLTAETATGRALVTREIDVAAGESHRYRLRLPKRAPQGVKPTLYRVQPAVG